MPELKTQLMKWLEDLETLSNTSIVTENTHNVALEKYLITMDFMSNEVVGYFKNFNVESSESKKIITKLESMVRDCVEVLVGYASFVEVSFGCPKTYLSQVLSIIIIFLILLQITNNFAMNFH